MADISLTWTGDKEFEAFVKRAPNKALLALAGSLHLEGETIMTNSIDNYVPKDDGTLANSGFVTEPDTKGTRTIVTLGFGGSAAAYALAVHEHVGKHVGLPSPRSWWGKEIHWSVAGSGPKYLEKPVLEAKKGLDQRMGRRIRSRMEAL